MLARLQAMPLKSDTTDVSTETVESGKEMVNAGYMAMLAQRGVPLRDHALLGSDDSTDAGGGFGAALNYTVHPRGIGTRSRGINPGINGGRFTGQSGRGRSMILRQENAIPLQLRKMSSV